MADWNVIKEKTKTATAFGVNKAKELGDSAKLNLANMAEEDKIRQAYVEIGMQYVAMHGESPEPEYTPMVAKIRTSQAIIAENKLKMGKDV